MEAGLGATLSAAQRQQQRTVLSQAQMQGLKYLQMNLPSLRAELLSEMSRNPLIEDVEPTLEKATVSEKERELADREKADESDYTDRDEPDPSFSADAEAVERRQRFLESRVREETLEEHLLKQLVVSDVAEEDRPLAEILIGDLDERGWFAGSVPDVQMVTGESEAKIRETLAQIRMLDPPGCGATTLQECLLAQLDQVDLLLRGTVRKLIARHLDDIAANRLAVIERDLGIDRAEYVAALKALRALEPRPGRAYRRGGHGPEYVNPEVHALRTDDGKWLAVVDGRSIPRIRLSPRYLAMLADPSATEETKAYVRERIAAARAIMDAVADRQQTITDIAQAIFDAQPGFFEQGLKGLRPLTEQAVADKAGVSVATVSRTVRDKYATTPKGTIELRRLFASGIATDGGGAVSRDAVLEAVRGLVAGEDPAKPLADAKIADLLKARGIQLARRTVAKYRGLLGIPDREQRRKG